MKNDLVSRASAIDIVRFECGEWEGLAKTIIKRFEQLPSAQPERKRGKWIDYANSHCECSVCHTKWSYFQNEVECFEFCPNCGADMRGEQDE